VRMLDTPRACVNQESPGPARGSYRAFRMLNFEDLGGNRTGLALGPRSDRHKPAKCGRSPVGYDARKRSLVGLPFLAHRQCK
jgi:hypothetical protein